MDKRNNKLRNVSTHPRVNFRQSETSSLSRGRNLNSTVRSEKKGTFICELILERYIYLRNTQKQLKITTCGREKNFIEFYLVCHGFRLKLPGSILKKLGDSESLCIKIGA